MRHLLVFLCLLGAALPQDGVEYESADFEVEYIYEPITVGKLTGLTSKQCKQCSCGVPNRWTRIVGGWMTEVSEYPWMVALLRGTFFFCGGTLINDRYIMTAAHCVQNRFRDSDWVKKEVKVVLAEHNMVMMDETMKEVRGVADVYVHPDFSRQNFDSDIALLRLDEPVNFRQGVRPACLPPPEKQFVGERAVVAGWGTTTEGGTPSAYLQETVVPILSKKECNLKYREGRITKNMICAGDDMGSDSCQGDSGGALLVTAYSQMITAGVVSWGEGCGRPGKPGVYTRVNQFLDWIVDTTRDACYCF